jgi:azurin
MFLQPAANGNRIPLAGAWKYRVERQTNAGALYSRPGELAAHVGLTAAGGSDAGADTAPPAGVAPVPDVVVRLGVVPIQMKFDRTELTVAAGQLVEIVFVNPDVMQHNFVLGAAGSLEAIGLASDELAKSPDGLARQYVPDMPQVLFATKLVEPGQTVRVQFRAPADPGQYPYVCTFPAHWRLMSGVLHVVPDRRR